MDLNLTGKHALVCGAAEGIGRATAQELALLGASVTVLARRAEALQEVAAALPRVDGQAHDFIAADVSRTDALRESIAALVARAPVHILVNNTGGPPGGAAHEGPVDAYLAAFNKHLVGKHTLPPAVRPGKRPGQGGPKHTVDPDSTPKD